MLISICLIALAANLPARSLSYETLLNTPLLDPCNQFTEDADMVVLYLDMSLEGGEVEIRLPRVYLEDRFDQQSGLRHGSLLLHMTAKGALPISREQARRLAAPQRNTADSTAPISLLIGDFPDLDEVVAALTNSAGPSGNTDVRYADKFGLDRLSLGDVFVAKDSNGALVAVLECVTVQERPSQTCTHYMRAHSIDVVMDYPASLLPTWSKIQARTERFLHCATGPS